MTEYGYVVDAIAVLPAFGKYAAGGRATRQGEISALSPMSEQDLRAAVARDIAEHNGIDPSGITFAEFTFTELPASGGAS